MSLISLSSVCAHNLAPKVDTAGNDVSSFTTTTLFDNDNFLGFGISPNGQSIIYIKSNPYSNTTHVSTNYGVNFAQTTKPPNLGRNMYISNDGKYILVPETGGSRLNLSINTGTDWTTKTFANIFIMNCAMSETGQYMAVFGYHTTSTAGQGVHISNNYGSTFARTYTSSGPRGGCMSPNGKYLFVATNLNNIDKVSSDFGQTWQNCGAYPGINSYTPSGCHISGNGKVLIKNSYTSFDQTYISTNSGSTFTKLNTSVTDLLVRGLYYSENEPMFSINYDGSLIFLYMLNSPEVTLAVSKNYLNSISVVNSNIKTTNNGIVKGSKYGKYVLLNAKSDVNGNNKFLLTTFTNITEILTEP